MAEISQESRNLSRWVFSVAPKGQHGFRPAIHWLPGGGASQRGRPFEVSSTFCQRSTPGHSGKMTNVFVGTVNDDQQRGFAFAWAAST